MTSRARKGRRARRRCRRRPTRTPDRPGRRVETRLLLRHDDGSWSGLSYAWNAAESDADLVTGRRVSDLGGGRTWTFPSRADCLHCHTSAAGRTLGLELGQLDRDFTYPNGVRGSQLANLAHAELREAPTGPVMPPLVGPRADGDLGARARSYLHANCSFCHRPGTGVGAFDLRFEASLAPICDAIPRAGTLGIAGARILAPGDPARSTLAARMHRTGTGRMPPLGSHVVDTAGTDLVDGLIRSAACR